MLSRVIAIVGFILIGLNTLIFLLITNYGWLGNLLVDFSILSGFLLMYFGVKAPMPYPYKMGYVLFFALLTSLNIIASILSPSHLQDNFYVVMVVCLFSVQLLVYILGLYLGRKFIRN